MSRVEYMKSYQKEYQRKRYEQNKKYFIDKSNEKRKENIKWFNEEIVPGLKCVACMENHPAVLDFHHRDPSQKEVAVSTMVRRKCSKEKILKEIAKCDVLCSNCHRKLHWYERQENN